MTALAAGYGNTVWVGTDGAGVLRIARGGEKIEHYGASQGCEIDVVRGMVAVDKTLFVIGEGPAGPRAAYYDGERFYSYELTSPAVLEWAARAGARTLVGSGAHLYTIAVAPPPEARTDADARRRTTRRCSSAPCAATSLRRAPSRSGRICRRRRWTIRPNAPKPPKAITPPSLPKGTKIVAVIPPAPQGPPLVAEESALRLPDGVTAVAGRERGLLVGTRFLGALRIENDVPRQFRINDLAAGAVRLTVACVAGKNAVDDCYLATGGTRAFRFDGQAFEIAQVDPEPGSHVLAVLRDPKGDVLAIHRGNDDRQLRISRVDDGRWTPIGIQSVQVPLGAPGAQLRGVRTQRPPVGRPALRRQRRRRARLRRRRDRLRLGQGRGAQGAAHRRRGHVLPEAPNEAWFATRSGAARLLDGKLRVFTENDGMESELTRDIGPGPDGQVFVATRRGTGRFDGTRWTFSRLGAFYPPATSLGARRARQRLHRHRQGALLRRASARPTPSISRAA